MRQVLFEIPGIGVKVFGYGLMLFFAFIGSMNIAAWWARREKMDPKSSTTWRFTSSLVA